FIKSSVEDLVPILSESEDTSKSDSECILPSCDYFSPIDALGEKGVTFSNPLFNSNNDFTSSDDESLSDEDVPNDNFKIYSKPLFEFDDEYISSNVNPLFDEVLEDIECKDSQLKQALVLLDTLVLVIIEMILNLSLSKFFIMNDNVAGYTCISGSIDDVARLFVNVSMLHSMTMTFVSGSCWDMLMSYGYLYGWEYMSLRGSHSGLDYCSGSLSGKYIVLVVCQMGTFKETLTEGEEGAFHLGLEQPRVYSDLSPEDKERCNTDIRATNILLQGLPKDIYALINHYTDANDI
nr:hypothetical protein [Tanacetum cinerariifolium]